MVCCPDYDKVRSIMNKKWLIGVACVSLVAVNSGGWANPLPQELSYLLEHHPLIMSAQAQSESASQDSKVARAGYLPSVSIGAEAGWEDQERPNGVDQDLNPDSAIIQLRQLLWDFGATSGAVESSRLLAERAVANGDSVRQDLLLAGIQTYFNLVLAEEQLMLAMESEKRVISKRDVEQRKLNAGRGSQADVLQAETQQLGAHSRVVMAEGSLAEARNTYMQVFGKSAPEYSALDKEIGPRSGMPGSVEAAVEAAIESSPALAAARLAADAAASNVSVAKADYYPHFELAAESEYRNDSDGIEGKIEENRVLIRMNYDFDFTYSKKNVVAAARARQTAAQYNSAHLERVSREAVENAWETYETAVEREKLATQQVSKATQFLELAEKERELGKRTLQDILSGELIRLSAQTAEAQARVDVSISAFGILRAMGRLDLSVF